MRSLLVLLFNWYETEDALKSMRSWLFTISCCSLTWLAQNEGLWRVWGLWKSTVFVLLPNWQETKDALKSMRSLQVYFLCSVTWLAWNGGFFEKYEVCGGLSFLFCYMTGTKQRMRWSVWGLWGLLVFCYYTGTKTEEAFEDCQDFQGLT